MAKLYLIRHAESVANAQGMYQGQTYDTELSYIGAQQAKALKVRLKTVSFARVEVSPLKRTRQTAEIIVGGCVPIHFEPRLIETNHGRWEGLSKEAVEKKWNSLYRIWLMQPSLVRFPGGESFLATQRRVLDWWREYRRQPIDTLVVTHDNILRILIADILRLGLNAIWQFHLYPTAITTVEVERNEAQLIHLNDAHHLEGMNISLAKHAL